MKETLLHADNDKGFLSNLASCGAAANSMLRPPFGSIAIVLFWSFLVVLFLILFVVVLLVRRIALLLRGRRRLIGVMTSCLRRRRSSVAILWLG
jgi:hypothetical protein